VVPCGKRALAWVRRYLAESRPELALEPDDGVLFLSNLGEAIGPSRMSQMASDYIKAADIGKGGSVHTWRHSCATALLEAGMDVRQIQVLLEHQELRSTAIYTQVSIRKLQELHALLHPAETQDNDGP
jgi:integrase/recombinase XerD